MSKDLRTFLDIVKPLGADYYRESIKPIDPNMELGILQYKLAKEGHNPVIYCPHIIGSKIPVVTNVLGNYELLGIALDIPAAKLRPGGREIIIREFGERVSKFRDPINVPAQQAPVREVILKGEQADLTQLPIMRHAPLNAGKYLTASMTILKDPDTGIPNVGVYRQELKGPRRLAVAPNAWQHGGAIAKRYVDLKKPMEVAIVIGHHPACFMGAAFTRPDKRNENEFRLMGALLNEPLEVTQGLTVDLPIPARAEIVIEGIVDPLKMEHEGPFSEGAGFYADGRDCWVMDVTAITMRHDAMFQDLHPIHAEHWFSFLLQSEYNVFEAIRKQVPGVRAVHRGPEGNCAKNLMYVSIKKQNDDDVLRAGTIALQTGQPRLVVMVDDDIDACDESEVLWALATGLRRVVVVDRVTGQICQATNPIDLGSPINPKTARPNSLLILDATKPHGVETLTRVEFPKELLDRINTEDYFPRL